MTSPRYIFLHADTNEIFTTVNDPTLEDLEGAEVGTQVIMRLSDHHFYGYAGKWLPIPAGKLTFTDTEDNQGQPFHVPPDYDTPPEIAAQNASAESAYSPTKRNASRRTAGDT